MHFIAHCIDKDGAAALRQDNRPDHLAWLASVSGSIPVAGPYLSETGAPVGSMLIVEAADRAAAEALLAADPYARAGLFATVTVTPWRWVIGAPAA